MELLFFQLQGCCLFIQLEDMRSSLQRLPDFSFKSSSRQKHRRPQKQSVVCDFGESIEGHRTSCLVLSNPFSLTSAPSSILQSWMFNRWCKYAGIAKLLDKNTKNHIMLGRQENMMDRKRRHCWGEETFTSIEHFYLFCLSCFVFEENLAARRQWTR